MLATNLPPAVQTRPQWTFGFSPLMAAFVAGAWVLQRQAHLANIQTLWIGMGISFSLIAYCGWMLRRGATQHFLWLALLASFAFGFVYSGIAAQQRLAAQLSTELEGRDLWLLGTVANLPAVNERGQRFYFQVEQTDPEFKDRIPQNIYLSWYNSAGQKAAANQTVTAIKPGQRWRLQVRLKRPHGTLNPYGFDYENWLLQENLRATGTVRVNANNVLITPFVYSFQSVIDRMRDHLRQRIFAALPNARYAGVITALVIGDQRVIDQHDWEVFNKTGIGHLISISGLHITMLAGFGGALTLWLWRWAVLQQALPKPVMKLNPRTAALIVAALVGLIYALLAGWGVPARRTAIMLIVASVAWLMQRQARAPQILAMALFAVVLIDPWAVLSAGFWLSFGAVALIFYISVGRARALHIPPQTVMPDEQDANNVFDVRDTMADHAFAQTQRWRRWRESVMEAVRVQGAISLGLAPLTVAFFGSVSLIGPLANAIAIPVVSFIVTPLAIVGALIAGTPVTDFVLIVSHQAFEWLMWLIEPMANMPLAAAGFAAPSTLTVLLAVVGLLWLLAPPHVPWRIAAWLCFLPMLLLRPASPNAATLEITALDIGQGTSVLIRTGDYVLLYDTGPKFSNDSDAGNRVIMPHLRGLGVRQINALVISHDDNDHAGGAPAVLRQIPVQTVYSGLRDTHQLSQLPQHQFCSAGQRWQGGAAVFEFISPTVKALGQDGKTNARSCVLKVTLGRRSVLLTGDIEADVESNLLQQPGLVEQLKSDILIVPHHGSRTSSTQAFLAAVQPKLSIVQAGYRNRFNHPNSAVMARYAMMGLPVQTTAEQGAIIVRLTDASATQPQQSNSLQIEWMRHHRRRYWHDMTMAVQSVSLESSVLEAKPASTATVDTGNDDVNESAVMP